MPADTFHIDTLGCKANQYDSRRIAEALGRLGLRRAVPGEPPGVHVINTCTVTHVADRKSRQLVRRAVRQKPPARVFVTGCYATRHPRALRQIAGVEGVFARAEWNAMLEAIAAGPLSPRARIEGDFGVAGFTGRARAYVKIQEGCDFGCAYCVVPGVRGRPRSRPLGSVLDEARRLIEGGFQEIVLTGIHLGLYGRDLDDGVALPDVVERVARLKGVGRVRLSSIEAPEVSERLLEAMRHPAVCEHLHLALQSGDDRVLARMRRRYDAATFLRAVELARSRLDRPAVTGDVIVGFPGETEEEFESTLRVCREAAFSRTHVFAFSPRPGTPAAQMPGRVPSEVVKQRCARLKELARKLAEQWARSFVGRTVRVLFEEQQPDGALAGYTDRYVRLAARGDEARVGELHPVRCERAADTSLQGRILAAADGVRTAS